MMLLRLWLLRIATYIEYASFMVLSRIIMAGLLLWTVQSVNMGLSWYYLNWGYVTQILVHIYNMELVVLMIVHI